MMREIDFKNFSMSNQNLLYAGYDAGLKIFAYSFKPKTGTPYVTGIFADLLSAKVDDKDQNTMVLSDLKGFKESLLSRRVTVSFKWDSNMSN